jgi:hypothetical protein
MLYQEGLYLMQGLGSVDREDLIQKLQVRSWIVLQGVLVYLFERGQMGKFIFQQPSQHLYLRWLWLKLFRKYFLKRLVLAEIAKALIEIGRPYFFPDSLNNSFK